MKNKRLIVSVFIISSLILLFCIYYFVFLKFNFCIPCIFHEITNLYCPGCGVTRMLFFLIKLEFYQAFRYNVLLFISLPFSIYVFSDMFIKFLMYRNDYFYKKINNKIWCFLLVIVLIYGIFRNIPMFDFLKPTDIM